MTGHWWRQPPMLALTLSLSTRHPKPERLNVHLLNTQSYRRHANRILHNMLLDAMNAR